MFLMFTFTIKRPMDLDILLDDSSRYEKRYETETLTSESLQIAPNDPKVKSTNLTGKAPYLYTL